MRNVLKIASLATMGTALAALIVFAAQQASATTILYSSRSTFDAALGTSVTDDYENPGYTFSQNDAAMNAVLGETKYQPTGNPNVNLVFDAGGGNHAYCAGCNGSFTLDFTSTSVGTSSGVFGVGLDILDNGNPLYTAFVTFGDNSTQDFSLAATPPSFFFGLTSDLNIASIAFGPGNGGTSFLGTFAIDNLTIGSAASAVPEPATLLLLASGLFGLGLMRRRKAA